MTTSSINQWGRHSCLPGLRNCFAVAVASWTLFLTGTAGADEARITRAGSGDKTHIAVRGLSATDLKAIAKLTDEKLAATLQLRIVLNAKSGKQSPAMLGDVSVETDSLVFRPRFPLRSGQRYQAVYKPAGKPAVTRDILMPFVKPPSPGEVVQVYPTAAILPENLLKFYVHFSVPMSRGEAYDRITLLDSNGKKIADPFLELGEELWDRSGKRFTLFFDPGRIKRGLKPREDVGPVLEEGRSYVLVVDRTWRTAARAMLKSTFRKPFKVGPPDDKQPDPKRWKLQPPKSGTRDPLTILFEESLDHAMLHRVLVVLDPAGKEIGGTIAVDKHETRWRFIPKESWSAGKYQLRIATNLEDRSGNSIGRPFEVDVTRKNTKQIRQQTTSLAFVVGTEN